jgi:hypothetical protein
VAEKFLGPLDAALQVANGGHATEFDADRFIVCATSGKTPARTTTAPIKRPLQPLAQGDFRLSNRLPGRR